MSRVARRQRAVVDQIGPAGEQRLGQGPGLGHRQARGDRQALNRRNRGVLGVSAAGEQGADAVTNAPAANVRAHSGDTARHFRAGNLGRDARRGRVMTLTLDNITAIEARSFNANQQLVRGGPEVLIMRLSP